MESQEKIKYQCQKEIKSDAYNYYKDKDIDLEKEVIHDLIKNIPLEELKRIFKVQCEQIKLPYYPDNAECTRITASIEI